MLAIILAVVLVCALVFLIYSVIRVVFKSKENIDKANVNENTISANPVLPYKNSFDEHVEENAVETPSPSYMELEKANEVAAYSGSDTMINEQEAPVSEPEEVTPETPVMPTVPGTEKEELVQPEPLQAHVSIKQETHSPLDPYEKNENTALFGSNLRHPEAFMEKTTPNISGNLEQEIIGGLANQVSKPTDLDKVQFSAEMAQNGGEFMNGIFAYDSTESGSYFSSL